jgi:hypothetical protein
MTKPNNTYQDMVKMWDVDANDGLAFPYDTYFDADTVVFWKCENNHRWDTKFKSRFRAGCPYCSGRRTILGINDLETTHPHLIEFWSSRNDTEMVSWKAGSSEKVWWKCQNGHEIQRRINLMATKFRCDVCESFGFKNPDLVSRWNVEKNGNLTPYDVSAKSAKTVWWKCNLGHEWEAKVFSQRVSSCPACSGYKIIPGLVDVPTLKPWLVSYWSLKNSQAISEIHPENNRQFFWDCKVHLHTWQGRIFDEPSDGYNPCKICRGKTILENFNDLGTIAPELVSEWDVSKNTIPYIELGIYSSYKAWWKCNKGHEWEAHVIERTTRHKTGCPECAAGKYVSNGEEILANYITNIYKDQVRTSVRNVIPGELDIYIPTKKIAIEYNGLYWHSEVHKEPTYHYDKWLACKTRGIQLIQVWEDDWQSNPEQIKRMIAHKLGVSQERTVFARKTVVKNVTRIDASVFLEENHIQGNVDGSIRVGLYENDSLTALMVLKKEPKTDDNTYSLLRYATSLTVAGGFSKLLKYVEKTYSLDRVITFSDNTVSDGNLYSENGFIADKELPPDYMYVFKGKRAHKFGYRLKRFKTDPNLKYEEGLTERELAQLNNLIRVWDAGKTRWVKTF